nr:hypothetical protein [uncultured Methanoregula sp.]
MSNRDYHSVPQISHQSLITASQCGRKGIGVEIDPHYCEIALGRIGREGKQE